MEDRPMNYDPKPEKETPNPDDKIFDSRWGEFTE